MADVVLVHGIAQEQHGPDKLERLWVPDLAGGIRATRQEVAQPCADALVQALDHEGDFDVRMAFYGDLFLDADAHGVNDSLDDLTPPQQQLADELAKEWLERAATRPGHPDQHRAAELVSALAPTMHDQGTAHHVAAAGIRSASRLRWLAIGGMSFAQSFVQRSLRQVTLYLTDPDLRAAARARIGEWTGADTRVIIAHSLGSVVAYEFLMANPQVKVDLLLTLGSPLGLRSIVYERLEFHEFPTNVARWVNVFDRDDLVAAEWDLHKAFGHDEAEVESVSTVDNGAKPHEAGFYLAKKQTAQPVLDVLGPTIHGC